MNFFNAWTAVSRREPDRTELAGVTRQHAIIGIVLLIVVLVLQVVIPLWSGPEEIRSLIRDFVLVNLVAGLVPLLIFYVLARGTGHRDLVPAVLLFLALWQAVLQIVWSVMAQFITPPGYLLFMLLGFACARAARYILGLSWPLAILAGVGCALAMFGASMLVFLLPAGKMLLAMSRG